MNITSEYCISGGCLFKVLRITSGVLKVRVTILSGLPGMVIQKHACLLGSAPFHLLEYFGLKDKLYGHLISKGYKRAVCMSLTRTTINVRAGRWALGRKLA